MKGSNRLAGRNIRDGYTKTEVVTIIVIRHADCPITSTNANADSFVTVVDGPLEIVEREYFLVPNLRQ